MQLLAAFEGWTVSNIILLLVVINYIVPDFVGRLVKAIKGETVPPPAPLPPNLLNTLKQQQRAIELNSTQLRQVASHVNLHLPAPGENPELITSPSTVVAAH